MHTNSSQSNKVRKKLYLNKSIFFFCLLFLFISLFPYHPLCCWCFLLLLGCVHTYIQPPINPLFVRFIHSEMRLISMVHPHTYVQKWVHHGRCVQSFIQSKQIKHSLLKEHPTSYYARLYWMNGEMYIYVHFKYLFHYAELIIIDMYI